jgi:outer membrane phospholipase A
VLGARFQLSFKYRLFDQSAGLGQDRPWLSGLYFGYTQNSLWDLCKPFRDTSYRPSLFRKWERADDKTWIAAARFGAEHESNGKDGDRSHSINMLFTSAQVFRHGR